MSFSRSTYRRRIAGLGLAAGLMLGILPFGPAALADDPLNPVGACVPVPVTTPGVTVLGEHVPAITHAEVCVFTGVWWDIRAPRVTQYSGCGSPCFDVKVDARPVQAGGGGVTAVLRWREDGIEKYPIPLITTPGYNPEWQGPQETCILAVGNPTPPC